MENTHELESAKQTDPNHIQQNQDEFDARQQPQSQQVYQAQHVQTNQPPQHMNQIQQQNQFPHQQYNQPQHLGVQQPRMMMMQPPPMVIMKQNRNYYTRYPVQITCQHCKQQGISVIEYEIGTGAHLTAGGLCLFGCWLGCCLIPYLMDDCKDVKHFCPNCKTPIGEKRFLLH